MSDHPTYIPGLGRGFLTPLYDVMHRVTRLGGLHDRMLDLADVRAGMRVLDVGCATGNLILALARRQSGLDLVGLDPDARALAQARRKSRRAGLPVDWRRGFAEELPYPDGSVDRIFSSLMLHHLERPAQDALLAEVRRVLRPDGLFVLADADGHDAMQGHGFRHLFRRRFGHGASAGPEHTHADSALPERVAEADFSVVSTSVYPLSLAPVTIVVARP
jgi:ubiquinone/menaquinone biosynthesis C-methylase UbiE